MRSPHNLGIRGHISPKMLSLLDAPIPEHGRQRYIQALQICSKLVSQICDRAESFGADNDQFYVLKNDLSAAMEELSVMLQDLNNGVTDPTLRAKEIGTRLSNASEKAKARSAYTVYRILLAGGVSAQHAHQKIAHALGVDPKRIKQWAVRTRNPGFCK